MSVLTRWLVAVMVAPLRLYKVLLSPLLPPACRFHPSCSVYAMGALRVHGPLTGLWLTIRRVSKCHPLHRGGLDPIPPRDGISAQALLANTDPFLAAKLKQAPPPWLAVAASPTKAPLK